MTLSFDDPMIQRNIGLCTILAILLMCVFAPGCATTRPPVQDDEGVEGVNPLSALKTLIQQSTIGDGVGAAVGYLVASHKLFDRVDVFYGTDRRPTATAHPNEYYGHERGNIEFGICQVSIPFSHQLGLLESPFFDLASLEDPKRHVVVFSITPMKDDVWASNLNERLRIAANNDIFIFVHGYNTSFRNACRRTAQLAYDLKFTGAPIMWSWPSDAKAANYLKDETDVEWSADNFRKFLSLVRKAVNPKAIHIVAHSLGNRAVMRALADIAYTEEGATPFLNQVVLTAPDIDRDIFLRLANVVTRNSDRVTLYASSTDRAIQISREMHGAPRAGDAGRHLLITQGIDTIDVSGIDTSFLGHSYFGERVSVISDLFDVLLFRKPPAMRFYLQPKTTLDGRIYWEFRR